MGVKSQINEAIGKYGDTDISMKREYKIQGEIQLVIA